MGLSAMWDKASGLLTDSEQDKVSAPSVEPDAQALYGNAFLAGGLFGDNEQEKADKAALREMVEGVREGVDRQMAEDDLREKFHVDEEGEEREEGKAAISKEEFDEMVALYSDIRRGKTDIELDVSRFGDDKAAADAFKSGTMDDLSSIMQTPSGRAMLKELAHSEHGTKVKLGSADDANDPGASPLFKGRTYENLGPEERWAQRASLDKGDPSSTSIHYAPGHTVKTDKDGEVQSDVVLYHELAHAYHFGKGDTVKGGKDVDGTWVENAELQATQGWHGDEPYTENRYRRERRLGLDEDISRRETYGGRDVDEGPKDKRCPAW